MLLDRRKSPADRRRSDPSSYKRLAKIQYSYGSLPRDCIITNVSKSGATVVTEDDDVPAEFTIIFSTGHSVPCRLGWRNGHEFAAEFIDCVRRCRRARRRRRRVAKWAGVLVAANRHSSSKHEPLRTDPNRAPSDSAGPCGPSRVPMAVARRGPLVGSAVPR